MDMYIKKNDRCHPLGFPEESKRSGSYISERRKYVLLCYVMSVLAAIQWQGCVVWAMKMERLSPMLMLRTLWGNN
jgi:hypothetical protein